MRKLCRNYLFVFVILSLTGCAANTVKVDGKNIIYAKFGKTFDRSKREAKAKKYMITSQGDAATEAGLKMFRMGGNAIDAAAAISFAISVERPQSTGIGGGGFMVVHFAKRKETIAIDFREKAPMLAHRKMYLDENGDVIPKKSLFGPYSVGVPGLVAGVLEAQKKYGKLSREQVLKPAIELAENGFRVYPELANALKVQKDELSKYPESRKIFFKGANQPLEEGDLLVQKDLAKTLRLIAQKGRAGFYEGPVADAIVKTMQKYKGLIRSQDLKNYDVKWRKPVWGEFRGYKIASMPPPSSGGIHVIQILNMLENENLAQFGPLSPHSVHLTASAMQRAFADRASYLGDSDFVKVPVDGLASKPYAQKLRASIDPDLATPSEKLKAGNPWPFNNPYESRETTHFTVMDAEGNTVSSTQTINYYFGSNMVAAGTGIVLNDEMDDFAAKPGARNIFGAVGSDKNAVEPQKRPLSSMSPTILFKDGRPVMALGTPSGTRIITCVAQTVLNYVVYKLPLFESVAMVRYHHQWAPDEIRVDSPGFTTSLKQRLRQKGHSINDQDLHCRVNAIAREGDYLRGVSDPRGEGLSRGE